MDNNDLEQKARELKELELKLQKREKELDEKEAEEKPRFRDNLYSRIKVSVKTMDIVIAVFSVLLVAAVVLGIVLK